MCRCNNVWVITREICAYVYNMCYTCVGVCAIMPYISAMCGICMQCICVQCAWLSFIYGCVTCMYVCYRCSIMHVLYLCMCIIMHHHSCMCIMYICICAWCMCHSVYHVWVILLQPTSCMYHIWYNGHVTCIMYVYVHHAYMCMCILLVTRY